MILIPFIPPHLENLTLQPGQSEMGEWLDSEGYGDLLMTGGCAYSLLKDGVVVGCGGIFEQTPWRGLAWVLLGDKLTGTDMIVATKHVRKFLDESKYSRIEAVSKESFPPSRRWLELLDFKCETPNGMINWFRNGENAFLFVRAK